jgi:hypothetical protein
MSEDFLTLIASQNLPGEWTVNLPAPPLGPVGIAVTLFDADTDGEAALEVNGHPVELWRGNLPGNDQVEADMATEAPADWFQVGINRLTFRWLRAPASYEVRRLLVIYEPAAPWVYRWCYAPGPGIGRLLIAGESAGRRRVWATDLGLNLARAFSYLRALVANQAISPQALNPVTETFDPADFSRFWP